MGLSLRNIGRSIRDIFDAILCYTIVMNCNDCKTKPIAKKLCNRHYLQMKRHGKLSSTNREKRPAILLSGQWMIPIGLDAKHGYVLIDEESKWLDKYMWSLSHGYPCSGSGFMHRIVMDAPDGMDVDHISGSLMDCRRSNLRICTRGQNNMNRKVDNKTGFKGVYWHGVAQKWAARIMFERKSYHLGLHTTPEDAAKAYDMKAKELFGKFARLNYGS